jgi:glycerol-1-phosphatase
MSQKPPKDIAGFIFDVDGCVARDTQALPGVPATLAHLRARGIRCAFMTNENMSTRCQVVEKLIAMGIPCTAEDVVTAAMVAAEVTRAFIAANLDLKVPTATGFIPVAGAMIKAVAYATSQEPLVTGKPSKWAGEMAVRALRLAPDRSAVVGDQLEQDIKMDRQAGLFTIAVLTGVTTAETAATAPEAVRPDVILPDVNHLPAWLDSLG